MVYTYGGPHATGPLVVARSLVRSGLTVIPLLRKDMPAVRWAEEGWSGRRTPDEEQVLRWAAGRDLIPGMCCNGWAVLTKGELVGIDLDRKHGLDVELWLAEAGLDPFTITPSTGAHVFAHVPGAVTTRGNVMRSIDIRGHRADGQATGYCVVAGFGYEPLISPAMAVNASELPPDLLEALLRPGGRSDVARAGGGGASCEALDRDAVELAMSPEFDARAAVEAFGRNTATWMRNCNAHALGQLVDDATLAAWAEEADEIAGGLNTKGIPEPYGMRDAVATRAQVERYPSFGLIPAVEDAERSIARMRGTRIADYAECVLGIFQSAKSTRVRIADSAVARRMGISRQRARTWIDRLQDAGFIERDFDGRCGPKVAKLFRLASPRLRRLERRRERIERGEEDLMIFPSTNTSTTPAYVSIPARLPTRSIGSDEAIGTAVAMGRAPPGSW